MSLSLSTTNKPDIDRIFGVKPHLVKRFGVWTVESQLLSQFDPFYDKYERRIEQALHWSKEQWNKEHGFA